MPGKVHDHVQTALEPSRGRPLCELDLCALAKTARKAFRQALEELGRDPQAYKLIVHADRYSGVTCEVACPGDRRCSLEEFDQELSRQN